MLGPTQRNVCGTIGPGTIFGGHFSLHFLMSTHQLNPACSGPLPAPGFFLLYFALLFKGIKSDRFFSS